MSTGIIYSTSQSLATIPLRRELILTLGKVCQNKDILLFRALRWQL